MTETPVATLVAKLHDVAKQIDYIEKHGRNDHHKYDFVQAVDVVGRIRKLLFDQNVMVLPGAHGADHLEYTAGRGGAAFLTTVKLLYRFVDIDSGTTIEVPWIGVGADTGGDKGVYKAYTGGLKYMLLTLFLVPTSNDPERDQLTTSDPGLDPAQNPTVPSDEPHKDDVRPAAPTIPYDRAVEIMRRATGVGMATLDMNAEPGTPPEFHAVFKALLGTQGVAKIGQLNADTAEAVEAWLANEEKMAGEATGAVV